MDKNHTYILPDSIPLAKLVEQLSQTFQHIVHPEIFETRTYFDTFDWRFFTKGLLFFRQDNCLFLTSVEQREKSLSANWQKAQNPSSSKTLPPGPLQEAAQSTMGIRALIPMAQPLLKIQSIALLNSDQKTVTKLSIKQFYRDRPAYQSNKPLHATVRINPVRGYKKEYGKCHKLFLSLGLLESRPHKHLIPVFEAFHQNPGTYSTKITLAINPHQPCIQTATDLFFSQLSTMRLNEEGILADIDTEFLHDFRVALRRTRAGLSELKDLFSPQATRHFKTTLKQIANKTNRLRDLDVYLLKQHYYQSLLPEALLPELAPLFALLKKERNIERQKVHRLIKSQKYKETLSEWASFLSDSTTSATHQGTNAQKATFPFAKKYIYKRWKKVLKSGRLITEETADSALHDLRLECKKLRYLIEFFASIFPNKPLKLLIKQLKLLQENLGDFNDLSVQQETLQEYLANQVYGVHQSVPTAAAIGGLIAGLNQEQMKVRSRFQRTFDSFDQPKNCTLARKIFGT